MRHNFCPKFVAPMLLYASNGKPTVGLIRDQQRLQSGPMHPHTTSCDNTMVRVHIIKILSYMSPLHRAGSDLEQTTPMERKMFMLRSGFESTSCVYKNELPSCYDGLGNLLSVLGDLNELVGRSSIPDRSRQFSQN
jgi:hypothetical protein